MYYLLKKEVSIVTSCVYSGSNIHMWDLGLGIFRDYIDTVGYGTNSVSSFETTVGSVGFSTTHSFVI